MAVKEAIRDYLGALGLAKSAYMEVKSSDFPGFIVGSCVSKSLNDVRSALMLKGIKIERVSGTIKGLKRKQKG